MTIDPVIAASLESLAGIRHVHAEAVRLVPKVPGLYAFYGDDRAWAELGLSPAGTAARIGDSVGQAAWVAAGFMISSYSIGVKRPSAAWRRRRW
jgi:hypothetical protein